MLVAPLFVVGCTDTVAPPDDAGEGQDARPADTGMMDTGVADGAMADTGMADAGLDDDAGQVGCTYPAHPNEMILGQAMPSFSWPEANDSAGNSFPLSLMDAFCDTDPNRDWGPSDLLLFISWPEW